MDARALFVATIPLTLRAFLLPFADHFRDEGYKVDALANGAAEDPALQGHFDARYDIAWSRNPLSPSNLLGTSKRIREIVDVNQYDLVHVHTPIAAFVTRYALRKMQPRPLVIYTAHGFHFYQGQNPLPHALYRTLEKRAASWTDYLVTINHEDFNAAKALGTINPAHVRYVAGIGVDCESNAPGLVSPEEAVRLRGALGVPDHSFMITMVAEMAPVKRHLLAFRVIEELRSHGRDITLVLVGKGPDEEKLRSEVATRGLNARILFAGYRDDVAQVLCASDLSMLVSEREGLPRSILESLACGTPAVGTQTRGIVDAIDDPSLIAGHDDPVGLAKIIAELMDDPERLRELRIEARRRAVENFSIGRIISFYDDLYTEAIMLDRRITAQGQGDLAPNVHERRDDELR